MAAALELDTVHADLAPAVAPPHEVVEEHFGFEVREVRPSVQARTVVRGGYRENLGDAVRVLAGYFYGGNRTAEGTSVHFDLGGPVTHTDRGTVSVVAVTLPDGWAYDALPRPLDPRVTLTPVPAARQAVLAFTGRAPPEVVAARKRELLQLAVAAGLEPIGEVVVAQLEAPWVLSANRRYEIRVPIA